MLIKFINTIYSTLSDMYSKSDFRHDVYDGFGYFT